MQAFIREKGIVEELRVKSERALVSGLFEGSSKVLYGKCFTC